MKNIGSYKTRGTGIYREIDKLGRIVIPMEMRKTLNIKDGDEIEFFLEDDAIMLRAKQARCMLCDGEFGLVDYLDKKVCSDCISKLKNY